MKTPVVVHKSPTIKKQDKGTYFWCACGKSHNQTFCDGSHQGTKFVPLEVEIPEPMIVAWCRCKHTKTPPYCDGSHKKL